MPNLQILMLSSDKCMFPMKMKYNSSFNLNCISKGDLVLKCAFIALVKCVKHLAPSSGKIVYCLFIAASIIKKGAII